MAQFEVVNKIPGSKVHGTQDVIMVRDPAGGYGEDEFLMVQSEGSDDPEVVEFWSMMVQMGIEACTTVLAKDGTGDSWYSTFDEIVYNHTGPQTPNPYWGLCKDYDFLPEIGRQLRNRFKVTFA